VVWSSVVVVNCVDVWTLNSVEIDTIVISIVLSDVGPGVSIVRVSVKETRSVVVVGTIEVITVVDIVVYVVPGKVITSVMYEVMYDVNKVE
jgi:hypothetical protein